MPTGDLWGRAARARARNEAEILRYEREQSALRRAKRGTGHKAKARGKICTECDDIPDRRMRPWCRTCGKLHRAASP
jgi:hypothetical protein